MPCKHHADANEGRSDLECEACELADKEEEAYWRQLYEGEKQAGFIPDPDLEADIAAGYDPRNDPLDHDYSMNG